MLKIIDATLQNLTLTLPNLPSLLAMIHVVVIRTKLSIKLKIRYKMSNETFRKYAFFPCFLNENARDDTVEPLESDYTKCGQHGKWSLTRIKLQE